MNVRNDISASFKADNIIRGIKIIFIFIVIGLALLLGFFILSGVFGMKSQPYFLFQNIGFYFFISSVIAAYSAVHRCNVNPGKPIRPLIIESLKSSYLIALLVLGAFLVVLVTALVELLISLAGYIPYAGPALIALLTLPFLIINLGLIAAVIIALTVIPPMVGEGKGIKGIIKDFPPLFSKKWGIILSGTLFSLLAVVLIASAVLFMVNYSAGITQSVQWNINEVYPKIISGFAKKSYITDIIGKIAPKSNPLSALKKYGSEIFNYIKILGWVIKVSFGLAFGGIVSVLLALHFNGLSVFYRWVKKGIID